jgi:heterodisulfide reductase subunit D
MPDKQPGGSPVPSEETSNGAVESPSASQEAGRETDSAGEAQVAEEGGQAEERPGGEKEARIIPIDRLSTTRLMQLDACTRCGECLNWCPVYDQDQREGIIPRTKVRDLRRILRAQHGVVGRVLRHEKIPKPLERMIRSLFRVPLVTDEMVASFATNLYECSTCGQCKVVCPANLDTVNMWENIRELIVSAGYGPLEPQTALVKSVKAYDNPWQQPRQARTKWARRAKKESLISDTPREIKKTKGKVLLFLGCTAVYDTNVRQIAINTVNILEALNVDYGCLGGDEKCCGSVMLRMGDPEFERIAAQNISQFNKQGIETLVTSCAGCYKTIKQDYPQVGKLDFEVLHIVEFLRRAVDEGRLTFPHPVERKITYHDPCHLGRAVGVFEDPRVLLNAIPGLELLEMERIREYSRCCGAGGGVKAGFPDIQARMAQRRIREAESTGAEDLVSACPFCFAGLQVGIRAMNSHLVMKDVTSLVAKSLLGTNAEEASQTKKSA